MPEPPTPPPVTRATRAFVIAGRWLLNIPGVTTDIAFTAGIDAGISIAQRDPAFAVEWQEMMKAAGLDTSRPRVEIVDELLRA